MQARLGKSLHVSTGLKSDRPLRTIEAVADFAMLYDLGREVMPSTHSYMQVHFAKRKCDGMECVIKVRFKPQCFRSTEDEKNWRHNTKFLMNMPSSCGVVHLYEVLEDAEAFYIVMEKVDGSDLFEILEAEGTVSVEAAKGIVEQLLSSLAHLHSHGAVHKDLKLENVMVGSGSSSPVSAGSPGSLMISPKSVKVIDFDTLEEWTPASPTSKDVVGTDQYISQEAYAGRYSPLSDIFAAGVIAYRLLAGRFPFHEDLFDDEAGENWVGSPKMAQIRDKLKRSKIDFAKPVFLENVLACDLVQRMLSYDESNRPSAEAALEHPWLKASS